MIKANDDEVREAAADHRLVVDDYVIGQGLHSGKDPSLALRGAIGKVFRISSANGASPVREGWWAVLGRVARWGALAGPAAKGFYAR